MHVWNFYVTGLVPRPIAYGPDPEYCICISLEMLTLQLVHLKLQQGYKVNKGLQVWTSYLSVDQFVSSIIDCVENFHEDAPSERIFLMPSFATK